MRTAASSGLLGGRYLVNTLEAGGPDDLVVALSTGDMDAALAAGVPAMPFHEAAAAPATLPRASAGAVVRVPSWRGYSCLGLLTWLLAVVTEPHSEVAWEVGGHPAPRTVHKRLAAMGWQLEARRSRLVGELVGAGRSGPGVQPQPRRFGTRLGRADLRLEADYGVFSQNEVDPGTRLLIQTMLDQLPAHPSLVDVGTGYGPIALALLANRWAGSARGTDIDSVALWLASRNASANAMEMELALAGDPLVIAPGTAVTCNFPTHAERGGSDRLLGELVAAARRATVVMVVHQSLELRFHKRVAALGGAARRLAAGGHAVLQLSS